VKQVEVAVIGTGWCGGIRAETLSRSALVDKLHICEIRPDRLAEVKALTKPATATLDYQDIIRNPNISVVYVCTTPEQNHYPITRDCLKAGKHVLLEKPIAAELWEDELITLRGAAGHYHRLFAAVQSGSPMPRKRSPTAPARWSR
jgi:myo-inositol 2-dehydrogenase/D-chiro-inositol 1-dehydrogenase